MFGASFTDHMLDVDWTKAEGWGAPAIKPLANLSLHPACSVFQYALEVWGRPGAAAAVRAVMCGRCLGCAMLLLRVCVHFGDVIARVACFVCWLCVCVCVRVRVCVCMYVCVCVRVRLKSSGVWCGV